MDDQQDPAGPEAAQKDPAQEDPAQQAEQRDRDRAAAAARIEQQARWVDLQVQQAMARGEFDDLPGAGKPIRDLGPHHDPDWWLKKLVEREQITGVLPPALQLRKDDAELDGRLDRLGSEAEVRRELEDFNARVIHARYTPVDGPPLITQTRDVEESVRAWHERRRARRSTPPATASGGPAKAPPSRRRWWRRASYRRG